MSDTGMKNINEKYWGMTIDSRDKVIGITVKNQVGNMANDIEVSVNNFIEQSISLFRVPGESVEVAKERAYKALKAAVLDRFDKSSGKVECSLEKIVEEVPEEAKFGIFFSIVERLAKVQAKKPVEQKVPASADNENEEANPAEAIAAMPGIEESDINLPMGEADEDSQDD